VVNIHVRILMLYADTVEQVVMAVFSMFTVSNWPYFIKKLCSQISGFSFKTV
jgi:hypothetical protein